MVVVVVVFVFVVVVVGVVVVVVVVFFVVIARSRECRGRFRDGGKLSEGVEEGEEKEEVRATERDGGGICAQGGRRKRDRDDWSETRDEEEEGTETRRGKGGGVEGGRGQCGGFDGRLVAQ